MMREVAVFVLVLCAAQANPSQFSSSDGEIKSGHEDKANVSFLNYALNEDDAEKIMQLSLAPVGQSTKTKKTKFSCQCLRKAFQEYIKQYNKCSGMTMGIFSIAKTKADVKAKTQDGTKLVTAMQNCMNEIDMYYIKTKTLMGKEECTIAITAIKESAAKLKICAVLFLGFSSEVLGALETSQTLDTCKKELRGKVDEMRNSATTCNVGTAPAAQVLVSHSDNQDKVVHAVQQNSEGNFDKYNCSCVADKFEVLRKKADTCISKTLQVINEHSDSTTNNTLRQIIKKCAHELEKNYKEAGTDMANNNCTAAFQKLNESSEATKTCAEATEQLSNEIKETAVSETAECNKELEEEAKNFEGKWIECNAAPNAPSPTVKTSYLVRQLLREGAGGDEGEEGAGGDEGEGGAGGNEGEGGAGGDEGEGGAGGDEGGEGSGDNEGDDTGSGTNNNSDGDSSSTSEEAGYIEANKNRQRRNSVKKLKH